MVCFQMPAMVIAVSLLILCAVIIVVSLVYLHRHDLYCKCSRRTRAHCGDVQQEAGEKSPLLSRRELDRQGSLHTSLVLFTIKEFQM